MKAVADKQYPGLVKDIFIGKGTYNQDLAPHAILLEFGTHTISKERVLNSADMMAKVVSNTLYGPQRGKERKGRIRRAETGREGRRWRFRRRHLPDCGRRGRRADLRVCADRQRQSHGRKARAKHQRNDRRPVGQKAEGQKRITNGFTARHGGFSACRAFFYANA